MCSLGVTARTIKRIAASAAIVLLALAPSFAVPAAGFAAPRGESAAHLQALGKPIEPGAPIPGTIINVTTAVDELNADGDCSLREALRAANTNLPVDNCPAGSTPISDTIYVPAGVYILTLTGANEDNGLTGDLDIRDNVAINGQGGGSTLVDGYGSDRVFHNMANATIAGVTVRNGSGGTVGGGGILNENSHTLVFYNSVVQNNTANTGGGLRNRSSGILRVLNSAVVSNTAALGTGGGILNEGMLEVTNSTIGRNQAPTYWGGGIYNLAGATANIRHSTIARNVSIGGGGIGASPASVTLHSSIVADNEPNDCDQPMLTSGFNMDGDGSCGLLGPGDRPGTDPKLGPLADNGGGTWTCALPPGSPAIDAGNPIFIPPPNYDQRGSAYPRVRGLRIDIGAFEAAPTCFVEYTGDNNTDLRSASAAAVQEAVDTAAPGAVVKVAGYCAGTGPRNGQSQTLYISRTITIQGGYAEANWLVPPNPAVNPTTLDAQNAGRVVLIPAGNYRVVLDSLTMARGSIGGDGGGIWTHSDVTLSNSIVTTSTAGGSGGGIWNGGGLDIVNSLITGSQAYTGGAICNFSILHMVDSIVQNNRAGGPGGGIANSPSGNVPQVILDHSSVQGNEAGSQGGGIYNQAELLVAGSSLIDTNTAGQGGGIYNGGIAWVENSTLWSNHATMEGGGTYNQAPLTVTAGLFVSNTAVYGGGIWNDGGTVRIDLSTLEKNHASSYGGGIANVQGGEAIIGRSTISHNTASNGGGLLNVGAETVVSNSTLSANTAVSGGGIYNSTAGNMGATLHLSYTTILDSNAGNGGGIYNVSSGASSALVTMASTIIARNLDQDCLGSGNSFYVSRNYNLDGDGSCNLVGSDDQPNAAPRLGPLADNGGPTWTHLPLAFSPAIDWIPGGANGCGGVITGDQRGVGRPIEGRCDIGAVELDINYPPSATLDLYTVAEDSVLAVPPPGVLGNDQDGDRDPLTAALDTPPANGLAVVSADGAFTYTPNPNFHGNDSFRYIATDGTLAATATVYVTVTSVCDYGVLLDPPGGTQPGNPGTTVVYTLSLTNTGDCGDAFGITLGGYTWPTTATRTVGPLDPGLNATLAVTVSVPLDALCGDWDAVTVAATSLSSDMTDESVLTTTANTVHGVAVTPSNDAAAGNPGADVVYTLRVTNTGNCGETLNVQVSGNLWPTSAPPTVGPLEVGAGATFPVTVTVSPEARCGDSDTADIYLTPWDGGMPAGNSRLTTSANAVYGVAAAPPAAAASGAPGTPVFYALGVTNTGNCTDSLALAVAGNAWPTTPVPGAVGPLAPGAGAPVSVTVDIPGGANEGDVDVAIVTCSSQGGNPNRAGPGTGVISASTRLTTTATGPCEPVIGTTFTWVPLVPTAGQIVTLSGSIISGTGPVAYLWNLGDGNTDSGATVTHTYATAGVYNVVLMTENACGADQAAQSLLVETPPPHYYAIYLPIMFKGFMPNYCGEAIGNGNFERGHSAWTEQSAGKPKLIVNNWPNPYEGSWVAWLGGYDNAEDILSQRFIVPPNVQNDQFLSFYLYVDSNDDPGSPHDSLVVRFVDDAGNPLSNDIPVADNTTPIGWTYKSIQLVGFAGIADTPVWVQFEGTTDISLTTNFVIDLVSMVLICNP